jgi:hypothetical protein
MVKWVQLDELIPHEDIDISHMYKIGIISGHKKVAPIIIDTTGIILDGHHRVAWRVFRGMSRIRAIEVDMFDPRVVLRWRNPTYANLHKYDVLSRALRGELFPSKTTQFMIRTVDGEIPIGKIHRKVTTVGCDIHYN